MKRLLLCLAWFPTVVLTLAVCMLYLQTNYSSPKVVVAALPELPAVQAQKTENYNAFLDDIPEVLGSSTTVLQAQDARPALVQRFLEKHDSPLVPHTQVLIDTADKYGLDYALIPAMAMQESNLCKKIPENSNNCWGYGIYGDKVLKFASYEEGIERVAKTLKEKYLEESLTNPDLIMSKWTPSSKGSWSFAVNTFMQEIKQGK